MKISWLPLVALALAACNRPPQNKDAIRQAVIEHVTKNAGLDVRQMNIEVGAVSFRGNQADAAVTFAPKNSPGQGMSMSYSLEAQGRRWVVKKREGGSGHGDTGGMPPGHPAGGQPSQQAPAGSQPAPSQPKSGGTPR